jgi:hypothetical protein
MDAEVEYFFRHKEAQKFAPLKPRFGKRKLFHNGVIGAVFFLCIFVAKTQSKLLRLREDRFPPSSDKGGLVLKRKYRREQRLVHMKMDRKSLFPL